MAEALPFEKLAVERDLQEYTKHLLTSLVNFEGAFFVILNFTDRNRLDLWIRKLEQLAGVPVLNEHFTLCPWSYYNDGVVGGGVPLRNVDGPDTCICCSPALIDMKFDMMQKEYGIHLL